AVAGVRAGPGGAGRGGPPVGGRRPELGGVAGALGARREARRHLPAVVGRSPQAPRRRARGRRRVGQSDDSGDHFAVECGMDQGLDRAREAHRRQAGAWMARARRLAEADPDCLEQAYLQLYEAEQLARTRAFAEMVPSSQGLVEAAVSGGDADLAAAALMMSGGALIMAGRMATGLAQLDEAMVAAASGDLSARATGMIYCVAIGICQELQELHRAREWSQALSDWCAAQPEFTGAYRGLCRVHRVVLLRLSGGWPTALGEARLACTQLTAGYGELVAGAAFYELAELHRLRGEFAEAEAAYRDALRYGGEIQPGMALLWLAQGRTDTAAAAIRRALTEAADLPQRAPLLPAAAEVLAAAGDLTGAAQAAAEL